jgi:hypothetical protein
MQFSPPKLLNSSSLGSTLSAHMLLDSSSHADVSAHIQPVALPKAWAAALPKNLHNSISLLLKQQHMSFSRAGQQYLHFLYVLDSSNSRTKIAWAARCLTPKPVQQHPKQLSSTSKAAAASFTPAALDSMDSSSSQGLDSSISLLPIQQHMFLLSNSNSTREVPSKLCWQQCFGAQKHQHFTRVLVYK